MNKHQLFVRRKAAQQHRRFRALLPAYALRATAPADHAAWQDLEAHLATCAACRAELRAIAELLHATAVGSLPPAADYPAPDLSFLPEPAPVAPEHYAIATLHNALDSVRYLIQFSETLLTTLRQPVLAGAYRGESWCTYQHPQQDEHDLHITIDVSAAPAAAAPCRVVVAVIDPQRPFDLEGSLVTLRYATSTHEAVTDQQGYVAFGDVPFAMLAQLQFTIVPRHD